MATYDTLTFTQTGPVTRIVLNRPDAANGINDALARELVDGLVTEVVPDDELAARADALATEMASAARASNAAVKKLLMTTFGNGLEEQMEIEGRLIAACADGADGREGIAAFVNKRAAKFA
ncbi:enoyl-CoA hydratase-related protein [Mycobacterium sp. IEC1808]|uniref:enoyl-CoA hydratase/isomerase family protein n=1 Tax=Mycobacterium sp. IEC1808 TaxID=1743230 RepID=UPI000A1556D5|nr:enoyl-CoA hydratase-related protein [Mycobacterium sp. IEC1808]